MKIKSTNRHFIARVAMLLLLAVMTLHTMAIPFAVFSNDEETLYLTNRQYINNPFIPEGSNNGISILTFLDMTETGQAPWIDNGFIDPTVVTRVVIESSFVSFKPQNLSSWFRGFSGLTSIEGLENLNTSEATNMARMFEGCFSLKSLNLMNFNTAKVKNTNGMFCKCTHLAILDISSFNTSQVTLMNGMFSICDNLRAIYIGEGWDTSKVSNTESIFGLCESIVGQDGTTWVAGNAVDKSKAHAGTGGFMRTLNPAAVYVDNNKNLYFTNHGPIAADNGIFIPEETGTSLTAIAQWSSTDVTASGDYPGWVLESSIYPFITHVVIEPSFSSVKPASTKRWFRDFHQLSSIKGLSYLNTSEVTDMEAMFSGCSQLTSLDLTHFDTGNVVYMASMFGSCSELTTLDISSFCMGKVTETDYMFKNCSKLTGINIPTSLKFIGASAFENCAAFTSITIPASVTRIGPSTFTGCTHLTDIYFDGTQTRWNAVMKGANWKPNAATEHWRSKVSFDTDGHGTPPDAQENLWSNEDKATRPADPSADGYVFTGSWYVDAGCTTAWDFDNIVPGDMTLYAGWAEKQLALNDGSANDLTLYNGQKFTVTLQGRTLYLDGDWNTLCLPFDVVEFDGTPLDGFTVKELDAETENDGHKTGFDSGTLYLNFKDATSIEAGKPYIVKMKGAKADHVISSEDDWNTFARNVSEGTSYEGKVVALGADISVSTMVAGTFKGTFDGNDHSITVNLSGGSQGLALFYAINAATIQNLKVMGTVTSTSNRPATFASFVRGICTIKNCWSSVDIVSTKASGFVDGGAMVANVDAGTTLNMTDCLFSGTITYHGGTTGGGMVGYTQSSSSAGNGQPDAVANLTNCFFCPSSLSLTVNEDNPRIFISGDVRGNLTNCYYNAVAKASVLQNEGIDGSNMNTDALAAALGNNWEVSGSNAIPKCTSGGITNPIFESVTISSTEPIAVTSEDGAVSFIGNYNPISIGNGGDNTILYMGEYNTLYYPNAAMDINAFRAYFQLNNGLVCGNPSQGGSSINAFVLNLGDETTGIVDIEFNSSSQKSGISNPLQQGWYTLDGRNLSDKPKVKGIYINNGKKVIIK